ncbi:hypothetical protein Tco_1045635 [Tanacetum coccineum]|uniref:Uncharacterized protein n=1 Tax=Tanacetum coccineum TaxID=301880 RepID=A0ABQ5GU79_9ASTR
MANIRSCNKHNMIACVEKTAQNADFYQIIDFLTGCSINTLCWVDPDLIGPWLQQFWATATLKVINDVPHIRAKVAGKKILISEATIRADLLFDDENGVDCFPKQVIWDVLRDIGYEALHGNNWNKHCLSFAFLVGSFKLFFEQTVRGSRQTSGLYTIRFSSIPDVVTALAAGGSTGTSPHLGLQDQQGSCSGISTQKCAHSQSAAHSQVLLQYNMCFKHLEEDEGLLDIYALNWEVRRLKSKLFSKLNKYSAQSKLKKLSKFTKRLSILSHTNQPQQPTLGTDPQRQWAKATNMVEEPKKKKFKLFNNIRAWKTTNDEVVARKIQAELGAERRKIRGLRIERKTSKSYLRKTSSLLKKGNQIDEFLKRSQDTKICKASIPDKGIVYERFKASIKRSFKDFIPYGFQRKKWGNVEGKRSKRLLRKRKATISEEEQAIKKPKLGTETIDELRNYLGLLGTLKKSVLRIRVTRRESPRITELQVIDFT